MRIGPGQTGHLSLVHLDRLAAPRHVDGAGHRGDGDHAAAVGGDEEMAAFAVRDRVAVLDLDVELALLHDLRLDAAAHPRAQVLLAHLLQLQPASLVQPDPDAVDGNVRLAHFGAQGVAHGKPIADLRFFYRAVDGAEYLHLAGFPRDHRLGIFPCGSASRRCCHARARPVPPARRDGQKDSQERHGAPHRETVRSALATMQISFGDPGVRLPYRSGS